MALVQIPTRNSAVFGGGVDSAGEKIRRSIPVIANTITDEDMGLCQISKLQPVNLKKVIKLLEDPHSKTFYDRHTHALKKVAQHFRFGFPMKDLVQIFKILNICADRVESSSVYEQPILELLKICSLSFFMEKTSDELVYKQLVVESISQLGYLMRIPSSQVRIQICNTLIKLTTEKSAQELPYLKPASLDFNNKMIELSDISETLVKSLTLLESDLPAKLKVLEVLQLFSKKSAKNCDQMLSADGGGRVCSGLVDPDPSGQLLFRSSDILWNLMEYGEPALLCKQLNNISCISKLRDAFVYQLTQGYSHYDRQLRNDLLVLATLIAFHCPEAPFVETGFAKQLTLFATFQEVKSHNALVRHLKLLTNQEDFELKKLLFNILVVLCNNRTAISVFSEGHLLLALFSYIRASEKESTPRDWSLAQFEELQLQAMSSLCTLCPLLLEDYMTCQGSTRLLLLLEWCVRPEDFSGHGNSFYGKGGRGSKKAQMHYCLRLMRSMVSTGDEIVLQDLADQGAINQLIGVLNTSFTQEIHEGDEVDIEMQTDILYILSSFCNEDLHRKELFSVSGVDMVTRYLRIDSRLLKSGLGHHKLLLASVDCTWCCIVGCFITEDYFLEKEGVFLLFDLLEVLIVTCEHNIKNISDKIKQSEPVITCPRWEILISVYFSQKKQGVLYKVCPKSMHSNILGCLLDLCENPKTVNHILTWRGKDGCTAAHLLCQMWQQEEVEIGAKRDGQGVLLDVSQPLMGNYQTESGIFPQPASCISQAIADVGENNRAKIYSLFSKMGFSDLPGITVADHVTLAIIEKYLDFKLGEVWLEIIEELHVENLKPISADVEAIEAISKAVTERAQIVKATQIELLEAENNQDMLNEQEFYAEIRENHRQKEKAIADFTDYVARTSNFAVLKAAKKGQELSIDMSRICPKNRNTDQFHATDLPNLTSTVFSGKHIVVMEEPDQMKTYKADVKVDSIAFLNIKRSSLLKHMTI